MPAAAVIPAPIAYIKVVAVKKLVVEFRSGAFGLASRQYWKGRLFFLAGGVPLTGCARLSGTITLRKIECLKQANA